MLILLTDGRQTITKDSEQPSLIAKELRKAGINLIVGGIGSSLSPTELLDIAGGFEQLYMRENLKRLQGDAFKKLIEEQICKGISFYSNT